MKRRGKCAIYRNKGIPSNFGVSFSTRVAVLLRYGTDKGRFVSISRGYRQASCTCTPREREKERGSKRERRMEIAWAFELGNLFIEFSHSISPTGLRKYSSAPCECARARALCPNPRIEQIREKKHMSNVRSKTVEAGARQSPQRRERKRNTLLLSAICDTDRIHARD